MDTLKKKILLIGGNGYIGSALQNTLQKNFIFTSCDLLMYSNEKEKKLFKSKKNILIQNFNQLKKKWFANFDYIIILAGLVGDPISKRYPVLSKKNDIYDMKKLIKKISESNIKKAIFISTCSNYGFEKSNDSLKETATLKPLSLYSKAKVKIENYILALQKNSKASFTILRFATAYGLSKDRMRFDLTINQFILEAITSKKIVVYDKDTIRPYCHVLDFSNIIKKVINAPKKITNFQVFNCGFNNANYSKKQIINLIKKYLNIKFKVDYIPLSKDKRNYRVNFSKLKSRLKVNSLVSKRHAFNDIKKYIFIKKKKNLSRMGNYKILS